MGGPTPEPVHVGAVIEDLQNEYDRSAQFLNDLLQSLEASGPGQRGDRSAPLEPAQRSNTNEGYGDAGIQIGRIDEEFESDGSEGHAVLLQRSPDPGADKQKLKPLPGPVAPLQLPKQAGPGAGGRASPHRAPNTAGRTSPHLAGSVSPTRRRQSLDVKPGEGLKGDRGARRSLDVSDSAYARKAAAVGGRGSPTLEPLPAAARQSGGGAKGAAVTAGKAATAASVTGVAPEVKEARSAASGAARFGRRLLNLFGGGKGTDNTMTATTHASPQQRQQPRPPQAHMSEGYAAASEHVGPAAANTDAAQLLRTRSGSGLTQQWTAGRDTAAATDVSGSQLAHTLTTDSSLSTSQHFDKLYSSELSGASPAPGSAGAGASAAGAEMAGRKDYRPPGNAASPDAVIVSEDDSNSATRRLENMAAGTNQRQTNAPLLAPGSDLPPAVATAPTAGGLPWTGSFASTNSTSFGPATLTAAAGASAAAGAVQEPPSLAEVLASASAEAQLPLRGGARGGRQRRSSLDFTPALPAHLRASLDSSGLPSLTALGAAQEVARMRGSLGTPSTAGGATHSSGGAGRLRPSLELFGGTAPTAVTRGETRGGGGGHSGPLNLAAASMQPAVQRAPGLQSGTPAQAGTGGGWSAGSFSMGQLSLGITDMGASANTEDFFRGASGSGASRGLHTAGGAGARYGGGGGGLAGGIGRYQAAVQPQPPATWAAADAAAVSSVSAPLPTLHGGGVWGAAAPAVAPTGPPHATGAPAAAGPPVGGWRVARAPLSTEDAPLPRIGTAGAAGIQPPPQSHTHHHHQGLHLNLHGSELPALRGSHVAATSAPGDAPPSPHCTTTAAAGAAAPGELVRHNRDVGLAARKATAPIRSGPGDSGSLVLTGSSGGAGAGGGGFNTVTLHPTADALLATMQTLHSNHHSQPNLVACSSACNLPQSPTRFASCPAAQGAIATAAAAISSVGGGGGGSSSTTTTATDGTASAAPQAASAPQPAAEAAAAPATEAAAAAAPSCTVAWATGSVSSGGGGGGGDMLMERGGRGGGRLDAGPAGGRGNRRSEVGEASPVRWAPQVPPLATLHPLQAEPITGIAGRAALAPFAPGVGGAALRPDILAAQSGRGSGGGDRSGGSDTSGRREALSDMSASEKS